MSYSILTSLLEKQTQGDVESVPCKDSGHPGRVCSTSETRFDSPSPALE